MGRTLLIVLLLAAGGGYYLYGVYAEQQAREAIEVGVRDARRSFSDKAASIVTEEAKDYNRRIREALKDFESQVQDVYEGHEDWRNVDGYRTEVERRFEEGEISEAQKKSMMEGFGMVKNAYDTLLAGSWETELEAVDEGADIRMDVYEVARVTDDDGNPLLEARAFLWGVEDSTRIGWGQLSLRYWTTGAAPSKTLRREARRQGLDPDNMEYVLGRAEGTATPYIILQSPSDYIDAFPPYVSLAAIRFPAMPREAETVDFSYGFSARKGGARHEIAFAWEKLGIPEAWKLAEGDVWNADVVEASEDEIIPEEEKKDEDEEG
ncbi:MAG: hypothetical protein AAGD10_05260 [Myxococcota bacterium]